MALAYFRGRQYADAETTAFDALKLDPKHAGTMRLYALVTFHQNKRAEALLGFCRFLALEPNTARSAEAYGNLQHILQGGALKPEPGQKPDPTVAKIAASQNAVIAKAIAPFAKRRYASAGDLLAAQLSAIFNALGNAAHDKETCAGRLTDYFNKLAQSPNMPAFARFINPNIPESVKWIKDHTQQMSDLDVWLKENKAE